MTPTIIGLHGHAGAGKDEIARLLATHGFERAAFADNVRDAVWRLNPVVLIEGGRGHRLRTIVTSHGWDVAKRRIPEVRDLLDRMGSDVGRDMHGPRVWVDMLFAQLEARGAGSTVITDVRAPNESSMIRSFGGAVVHVTRPGVVAPNDHPIHRPLSSHLIDYTLANDGDLSQLRERVDHLAWWAHERKA